MKRTLAIAATLGMTFAMAGCGGEANGGHLAGHAQQAQDATAWSVSLKSACTDSEASDCVGAYGFSISADGKYILGPTADGQSKKGSISPEELAALSARVVALASSEDWKAEVAETCSAATNTETQVIDSVTLVHLGKMKSVYSKKGAQSCFKTANLEGARALHDAIRALAVKYYALPFPDLCSVSIDKLHALYPSVQGCVSNGDCTYVSPDFEAIAPKSPEFVVTDNCSLAKPLAVANSAALASAAGKLQEALDAAQTACGPRLLVNGCVNLSGFQADSASPVCEQGTCKIPASQHP